MRGVGLPAGSENREILSLLDVIPIYGRLDNLNDRTALAGTTGFAGVLDGGAGREFKNVDSKLLTGSRSLGSTLPSK